MGYIKRHTIVVTDHGYGDHIESAHKEALRIFGDGSVSEILGPLMNSERSFFIPPDGSKEGWVESDKGDLNRSEMIKYLKSVRYEDGSSPLSWVEVFFGEDNGLAEIVNHSGKPQQGEGE